MNKKKKSGNLNSVMKYINPLSVFLLVSLLLVLLNETRAKIAFSKGYFILGGFLFIFLILSFLLMLGSRLNFSFKNLKEKYSDRQKLVCDLIAVAYPITFLYLYLGDYVSGRFTNLWKILGSPFVDEILISNTKGVVTFISFFYTFLAKIFNTVADPRMILVVNGIVAFFLFLMIYKLSFRMLKDRYLALLVMVIFSLSNIIRWNVASIEYSVISLLFALLSVDYLSKYIEFENLIDGMVSVLTLGIACFVRFEFCFLLGVPYLLYYSYANHQRKIKSKKFDIVGYLAILPVSYVSIAIINHILVIKDIYLLGEGKGLNIPIIGKPISIFIHNTFVQKDLALSSGYVSIFFYIGLIAALFFLSYFLASLGNKKLKNKNHLLNIVVIFTLFFIGFQLFFNMMGLRALWISTFNYFAFLVIMSFLFIKHIVSMYVKGIRGKYILYALVILVSVVALLSSDAMVIHEEYSKDLHYREFELLDKRFERDDRCFLLKASTFQPSFDYYLGGQDKAIFLGLGEEFYNSLIDLNKTGKCFYYHHDLSFQGYELQVNDPNFMTDLNVSRVSEIMGKECHPNVVFETETPITCDTDLKVLVIRYDC